MKLPSILFLLLTTTWCFAQNRGDILKTELLQSYSKQDLEEAYNQFGIPTFLSPIDYEVDLYKLEYYTPEPRGDNLTIASGLIYIPKGSCDFPLLSFQHGTIQYGQAPSLRNTSTYIIGLPFSANGYLTVLPDYVGYGSTPDSIPHAYVHYKSSATAVVDMLRAVRTFCSENNIILNDQLFLTGYSQGGYVSMAAHKEIQEFHSQEFDITASAPGAGPYELKSIMRDSILFSSEFSNPFYLTFTAEGYRYVYDIFTDRSELYKPPYDSIVKSTYDRSNPSSPLSLPWPAYDMLLPETRDSLSKPNHPLLNYFTENEVYDWVPRAPVNLYYCDADDQVPASISIFTADTMQKLGAENVAAISISETLDHGACANPAMIRAKLWFDTFREKCSETVGISLSTHNPNSVYPNPSSEYLNISEKNIQYKIFNEKNNLVQSGISNEKVIPIKKLKPGSYFLIVNNTSTLFIKQ